MFKKSNKHKQTSPPTKCKKVKNPCKFCFGTVTAKTGLQCQGACQKWIHFKCLSYTPGKIQDIKKGYIQVTCPCPDCDTDCSKKERQLVDVPYFCGNTRCPAGAQPVCETPTCPKNNPIPGASLHSCPTDCSSSLRVIKCYLPPVETNNPCANEKSTQPCRPPLKDGCCEPKCTLELRKTPKCDLKVDLSSECKQKISLEHRCSPQLKTSVECDRSFLQRPPSELEQALVQVNSPLEKRTPEFKDNGTRSNSPLQEESLKLKYNQKQSSLEKQCLEQNNLLIQKSKCSKRSSEEPNSKQSIKKEKISPEEHSSLQESILECLPLSTSTSKTRHEPLNLNSNIQGEQNSKNKTSISSKDEVKRNVNGQKEEMSQESIDHKKIPLLILNDPASIIRRILNTKDIQFPSIHKKVQNTTGLEFSQNMPSYVNSQCRILFKKCSMEAKDVMTNTKVHKLIPLYQSYESTSSELKSIKLSKSDSFLTSSSNSPGILKTIEQMYGAIGQLMGKMINVFKE